MGYTWQESFRFISLARDLMILFDRVVKIYYANNLNHFKFVNFITVPLIHIETVAFLGLAIM